MRRLTAEVRNRLVTQPLITSSLSLMSGTILTSVLGLVFWVVAANLYDRADFGVATTTVYTMMMLADVASLGLRSGLVRYLPLAGSVRGSTMLWGYGLAVLSTGTTAIGFLLGLRWWAPGLSELGRTALVFGFFVLATACWSLFNLQDAALVALRRAPWVPVENGIFGLLKIVLLFPMAAWSPRLGIFWAWTLPVFPIVVAINILIAGQLAKERRGQGDGSDRSTDDGLAPLVREMMTFSLADWVSSLARLAALVVVPLMVLAMEGDVEAGYFQAAWIIGFTVFTLSINAAHALLAENSHERHRERRNTVQAGLLSLGLTVPIVAVGALGAPLVLLVYGSDFAGNSSGLLRILLVAALPNVVHQINIGRLRSLGRMAEVIGLELTLSLIVVGLSWFLVPGMGIDGVGVAWLVGLSSVALYALIREWDTVRLDAGARIDLDDDNPDPLDPAGDLVAGS